MSARRISLNHDTSPYTHYIIGYRGMKSMISKSLIMFLSFPASRGGSLSLSTYSSMYRFNVSSWPRMRLQETFHVGSPLVFQCLAGMGLFRFRKAVRGHEPGEQVHVVKGHASGAVRIGTFHTTGDLVAFRHLTLLRLPKGQGIRYGRLSPFPWPYPSAFRLSRIPRP